VNLHRLRLFCAVAQAGSFAAASERLFISQPAMSHQIAAFEQELGVRLFDRTARGVRLTPAGQSVFEQAKTMLEAADEIQRTAYEYGAASGKITIGVTTVGGLYYLTDTLREFRQKYPRVGVEIVEVPSSTICRMTRRGDLAAGFVWQPVSSNLSLQSVVLWEDEAVLVEAPPSPVFVGPEPDGRRIVVVECDPSSRCCEDRMDRSLSVRPSLGQIYQARSVEAAKKMVQAGLGTAVLPARTVEAEVQGGSLSQRRPGDSAARIQLAMIYHPLEAQTLGAQEFIGFMLAREKGALSRALATSRADG
jgi:DNA-binding transcriptional LysR family regulator